MLRNIFFGLLSAGIFVSCSTDTTAPGNQGSVNEADLIRAIETAPNMLDLGFEQLPARSQEVLTTDYSESYVDEVKMAPDLGYKVTTRRERGTHIGTRSHLYFDLNGRELRASAGLDRNSDDRDRDECFTLVYPVTFIMPDGSEITGDDRKAICTAIRDWYIANPDSRERPALQYPVDVVMRDSTALTINSDTEMQRLIVSCGDSDRDDKDGAKCFELVYPVTYIMPDSTEITVENGDDWGAIKSWYEANPDSKARPALKYPVDVTLMDGTTRTVNSAREMRALKEDCNDWDHEDDEDHVRDKDDEHGSCFQLVYPVTFIMPDGSTITGNDKTQVKSDIRSWYEANPDSTGRPVLQYPVDIIYHDSTTITINNSAEMKKAYQDCGDEDDHHGDRDGDHDKDHDEEDDHDHDGEDH